MLAVTTFKRLGPQFFKLTVSYRLLLLRYSVMPELAILRTCFSEPDVITRDPFSSSHTKVQAFDTNWVTSRNTKYCWLCKTQLPDSCEYLKYVRDA